MILSRFGREYLRITITTVPVLTGWEASFDKGTTWVAGALVGSSYQWLLAGPNAAAAVPPATVLAVGSHSVLVRATDSPEVLVRSHEAVSIR